MVEHIVVVGGGQAAAQAIVTLRQSGFAGRITLVGEEPHLPYQRPPLSKKYLAGTLERARLHLRPASFYEDRQITVETGIQAESLQPASRELRLADGRRLRYDRLLLATGSRVRKLNVPGADLPGVHYIRTIEDADAIRADLREDRRAVIVGGGYIGLEAAAVARGLGLDVTVLEAAERVLARVVGPEVASFYHDYHTRAGVKIACGRKVSALEGGTRVEAVLTEDGGRFGCDLVIVGIGILPRTELAESAGLGCDDGLLVDELARTEHPDIAAAGDCTSHPNALAGRRVRLESVQNAIEQAKAAASTLLGEPRAYREVPWFWSDQYDLKLQIAGLSAGYEQVVIRRGNKANSFAAYYLASGRLIAVDAVNSPRDFMHGRQLIAARATPSPEAIADPDTELGVAASAARNGR